MPELEHEIAIYYDEVLTRHELRAKMLHDNATLELAKTNILYDEAEQVRVHPRFSSKRRPHFYSESTGKRRVSAFETDDLHNKRVSDLLNKLNLLNNFSLILRTKKDDLNCDEIIQKFPQYEWDAEVHRILSESTIVRHDIFGHYIKPAMSVNRPWIAIEVVHTHFPEEAAFAAILEASKNYPLLVIFDLTARPGTFCKIDIGLNALIISRWTYYIQDGLVHQNNQPKHNIKTSARLEIEVKSLIKKWDEYKKTQN